MSQVFIQYINEPLLVMVVGQQVLLLSIEQHSIDPNTVTPTRIRALGPLS